MYSLPLYTFTDYWRDARSQGVYIGGTLVLLTSTSVIGASPEFQNINFPTQTIKTVNTALSEPYIVKGQRTEVLTSYRIIDTALKAPVEFRETDLLPPGMSKIQEEGRVGTQRQVVKVITDGEVNKEEVIYQFELNAPKKRVVIQNSKPITGEKLDLSRYEVKQVMTVESTAYTYTGNPTATGVYPREGLIAVDPKVIPLGSKVFIEGYGYAIAADTGGLIKGHIVDVFFPTLQRCIDWGRRPVKLYLLSSK